MEQARRAGDAVALERLGARLAAWLGVSAAGGDAHGLWVCIEADSQLVGSAVQRMRWIWPGRFWMGTPDEEQGRFSNVGPFGNERPQHAVALSSGLWLGETAVTQGFWAAVTGGNPSRLVGVDHPVECVGWYEAVRMCGRLSARLPRLRFRLPTEAEWEHACRAGTLSARYGPMEEIAWCRGDPEVGLRGTRPVGLLRPNPWGLYDMLGNVWEWCRDRSPNWDEPEEVGYPAADERHDPLGTVGSARIVRGGSWRSFPEDVRAACRYLITPRETGDDLGFRLAMVPASSP